MKLKLGVNVDHVATVRQARQGHEPKPVEAALAAMRGGADSITVHLREDRRHIQNHDVLEIKKWVHLPLNLEMALNPSIVQFALKMKPEKICLVPERRQEITTEGGLDILSKEKRIFRLVQQFHAKKIEVSLFIAPDLDQVRSSARTGADAVELHTGAYANAEGAKRKRELQRLKAAARESSRLGLKVHAGHGLDYLNVRPIARIQVIQELNIGHSIVSRALLTGMEKAVRDMKKIIHKTPRA